MVGQEFAWVDGRKASTDSNLSASDGTQASSVDWFSLPGRSEGGGILGSYLLLGLQNSFQAANTADITRTKIASAIIFENCRARTEMVSSERDSKE